MSACLIQSGPALIVASGEVCTFMEHPLTFNLLGWTVHLRFLETDGELAIKSALTDRSLSLDLLNFGESPGRGSAQPVLIGPIPEGLLLFHFRCFRHGASADFTVHYTFFSVAEEGVIA